MPRYPRIHAPGLLYHVMARGNNGQKIFLKGNDYEAFLEALDSFVGAIGFISMRTC